MAYTSSTGRRLTHLTDLLNTNVYVMLKLGALSQRYSAKRVRGGWSGVESNFLLPFFLSHPCTFTWIIKLWGEAYLANFNCFSSGTCTLAKRAFDFY